MRANPSQTAGILENHRSESCMKKPSPKDATERNVKASQKRDDALLERIKKLERQMKEVQKALRRVWL